MATEFLKFTKHAVAESSNLLGTHGGAHIWNIKVTSDSLDNGTIIKRGAYIKPDHYAEAAGVATFEVKVIDVMANGNYLLEVVNPAECLLVLQPEIMYYDYTAQMRNLSNFFNAKDDIVRAYELVKGDRYALSAEGFTGAIAKGDSAKYDTASKKLKKVTG